jgi:peptidoglycan/xylan/chitin deacetylase (PgdA/CDA1 family)
LIDSEDLRERRAERARRRRARVRRRRAVAALVLAGIVVVLVLVLTGGGSAHRPAQPVHRAAAGGAAARAPAQHQATQHRPNAAVPILMYHVINAAPPGAPFPELYVPKHEFAVQMRALRRAGWTAITLDQLWAAWTRNAPLPAGRPIVISFDNGYESQFNNAMPVLRRLHWPGDLSLQLTGLPPSQGGLSREATRRILAAGWELDTQGISHADLIRLAPAALHHEVFAARRILQRRWHKPVDWFCYPSGHYDARVIAAVKAAGYRGSTTVVPGWARRSDDPFRLPRLRVVAGTSAKALLEQIAAARHAAAPPPAYG